MPAIDIDDPRQPRLPRPSRPRLWGIAPLLLFLFLLLIASRTVAGIVIDYEWWKEMGQVRTWIDLWLYAWAPTAITAVVLFLALWTAHALALHSVGMRLRDRPLYGWLSTLGLLVLSVFLAGAAVDTWTVVRFFGSRGVTTASPWTDPAFGKPLAFYLFDLPFYSMLSTVVLVGSVAAIIVFFIASRAWGLGDKIQQIQDRGEFDIRDLGLGDLLRTNLVRVAGALVLLDMAVRFYLDRYELVYTDHTFMVGVDYVNANVSVPLLIAAAVACVVAAALVLLHRLKIAGALVAAAVLLPGVVTAVVNRIFVKPNEISIQKPYIKRHIEATRSAYNLDKRTKILPFQSKADQTIDQEKYKLLLENVRLWDWKPFHDAITQIQALRPYYVFQDTDVDRYMLADATGRTRLRQVMVSPRDLDIRILAEQDRRWINPHFIYTHGYGLVMAESNSTTQDGLPATIIDNAPTDVRTPSLKITRPELYFSEVVHEPVFVNTGQPEFNYPSGSDNVHNKYEGTGGIPISSLPMRIAAALREGDWNILLTTYLTPNSKMLIRRRILDRVDELASFMLWDGDPYIVIDERGRLIYMLDGYTTSDRHPYARTVRMQGAGEINYIRNSVKATIDAYDGTVNLYIFDEADPIIQAYAHLFPRLFKPASTMPKDLRAHARYPETIFRVQAEIYRTFHMTEPEVFYNREDIWEIAKTVSLETDGQVPASPTYVVASLPDTNEVEFLLMVPFTPRTKENMIGMMVARCDGDRLGEIVILQLSKQELIFGPMQVRARINQDQNISKDLTLWNQQGSRVLQGQMLVLPLDDAFLYVQPIYLQAAQAPMPQLKKIALATGGSRIAYADTYEQAIAQIAAAEARPAAPARGPGEVAPATPTSDSVPERQRIERLRYHVKRYKEFAAQGKFADAGRELEALEQLLR